MRQNTMSVERPVTATGFGGTHDETVKDKKGRIPRQEGRLRRWIQKMLMLLIDNPEEAHEKMGKHGRKSTHDNRDSRLAAENPVDILKSIRSK